MRVGGSHAKGSSFERKVGAALSRWLTNGAQTDLFSRNVLSGGRFTRAAKDGKIQGLPGDLVAAHPLALPFTEKFSVECKHHADVRLADYLIRGDKSFLGKVYIHSLKQAKDVEKLPIVIAKSNRSPEIVLVGDVVGKQFILAAGISVGRMTYHIMHRNQQYLFLFEDLLKYAEPNVFLNGGTT